MHSPPRFPQSLSNAAAANFPQKPASGFSWIVGKFQKYCASLKYSCGMLQIHGYLPWTSARSVQRARLDDRTIWVRISRDRYVQVMVVVSLCVKCVKMSRVRWCNSTLYYRTKHTDERTLDCCGLLLFVCSTRERFSAVPAPEHYDLLFYGTSGV